MELEQRVARRERHLVELAGIPRAHDVPAPERVLFQALDEPVYLVDAAAVGRPPIRPLRPVYAPEIAVFVCPLVPNGHAVVVQVFYVGVALQEPQQLVNYRARVELLCCQQREGTAQVEARLRPEYADCADARAVGALLAVFEDEFEQVEILFHNWRAEILN